VVATPEQLTGQRPCCRPIQASPPPPPTLTPSLCSFNPAHHSSALTAAGTSHARPCQRRRSREVARSYGAMCGCSMALIIPTWVPFPLPFLRPCHCLTPNTFGCLFCRSNSTNDSSRGQNTASLSSSLSGANFFELLNRRGHLSERDAIAVLRYVNCSS